MKRKIDVKRMIFLSFLILIFATMLYHVSSTRNKLIACKKDLEDIQNGKITKAEAKHIPQNFPYSTPESIHPESAYIWSFPYIITEVIFGALYIVIYKT